MSGSQCKCKNVLNVCTDKWTGTSHSVLLGSCSTWHSLDKHMLKLGP